MLAKGQERVLFFWAKPAEVLTLPCLTYSLTGSSQRPAMAPWASCLGNVAVGTGAR